MNMQNIQNLDGFIQNCLMGFYSESINESCASLESLSEFINERIFIDFYPIGGVEIQVSPDFLFELSEEQFFDEFKYQFNSSLKFSGFDALEDGDIVIVFNAFIEGFENPVFVSNCIKNGWNPVTKFIKDSFLCCFDSKKISAWISFDDE